MATPNNFVDTLADQMVARTVRSSVSVLRREAKTRSELILGALAGLSASSSIQDPKLRRATVNYISTLVSAGVGKSDKSYPGA